MWGEHDPIIPVEHARAAHRLVPGSRLEIFPDAGHFPHLDDPLRFVRLLTDFMRTTEPANVDSGRWTELLRGGSGASTALGRAQDAFWSRHAPDATRAG
jgi:hypothetical protein